MFIATGDNLCNKTMDFFALVERQSAMLKKIQVIRCNLTEVLIGALTSSIESLSITSSVLPFTWFEPLSVSGTAILPHLRELDLSDTYKRFDDVTVSHIARAWPELRQLKLNDCSPRVSGMTAGGLLSRFTRSTK